MRIVRMKTKEELLEIGKINKLGDILPKDFPGLTMFDDEMSDDLIGKIIVTNDKKDYALKECWSISNWMIKEELNPDDYPEYYI